MEKTSVEKLAVVLRVLVIIVFVCNLIALLLVPGLVGIQTEGGLADLWQSFHGGQRLVAFLAVFWQYLSRVWRDQLMAVLTVFLWACGVCTAVILWQAKTVLESMVKEGPFTMGNAQCLKRAAVCCFVISGAALVRTTWGFFYYNSLAPLVSYNALFVPVFLMAGLVCMVMSALFRQAAELKAENDLTI